MPMRMTTVAVAAVVFGFGFSSANALEEVGQFYITPMATYIQPDGDIGDDEIEDGFKGGALAVGYALQDHWNMEVALSRTSASMARTRTPASTRPAS